MNVSYVAPASSAQRASRNTFITNDPGRRKCVENHIELRKSGTFAHGLNATSLNLCLANHDGTTRHTNFKLAEFRFSLLKFLGFKYTLPAAAVAAAAACTLHNSRSALAIFVSVGTARRPFSITAFYQNIPINWHNGKTFS